MDKFKGKFIYVDNEGNESPIPWSTKPTNDSITSENTTWSSAMIQQKLDTKLNQSDAEEEQTDGFDEIQRQYDEAVETYLTKANKSSLGNQVTYSVEYNSTYDCYNLIIEEK